MSAKFVFLTAFLCCSLYQLACANEEATIREAAIQKLKAHRKVVDDYAFKVSNKAENQILIEQTRTRTEHTGALKDRTEFEVKQIGAAYRFTAELLNANKYVTQCMEDTLKKARTDIDNFSLETFFRDAQQSNYEAGKEVMYDALDWQKLRLGLYREYEKVFDEAIAQIGKSDNINEIKSVTDNVLQKGEKIIQEAKKTIAKVRKVETDQLSLLDERLAKVRDFNRKSVDLLSGALQNCFLIRSPFFSLRNIFIKDNLL